MNYFYETNCTSSTAKLINDMTDQAHEVTYDTLARRVGADQLRYTFPFYTWGPGNEPGIRMKNDWAVAYFRSTYRGRPCYYVQQSSIEYIYTRSA